MNKLIYLFLIKLRFLVNYIGPFSSIFCILLFTPFYLKYFGAEDWSVIGLISLLIPFSYIVLFGSGNLITREVIRIENNSEKNETVQFFLFLEKKLFFRSIFFFLIIFSSLLFGKTFKLNFDYSIEIFIFLAMIVALKIIEIFYFATLTGLKDFLYFNSIQSFFAFLKWGGSLIIVLLFNFSIFEFLVIFFVFSAFQTIILKRRINYFFRDIKKKSVGSLFSKKFSMDVGIISIFILILFQFDKLIFFTSFTKETLSAYSLSFMIASALPNFILPMLSFFAPNIYSYYESKNLKSLLSINLKITCLNYLFSISCLLFIIFLSKIVLNFWLNEKYLIDKIYLYLIPLSIIYLNYNILSQIQFFFTAFKSLNYIKFFFYVLFVILLILALICYYKFSFIIFLYSTGISLSLFNLILNIYAFNSYKQK